MSFPSTTDLISFGSIDYWSRCDYNLSFQPSVMVQTTGTFLGSPAFKVEQWGCHIMIWSMQGLLQELYLNCVLTFPHTAIMQYRICCMYDYSRKIVILVAVAFTAEMLSMLVIDLLYLRRIIGGQFFIAQN